MPTTAASLSSFRSLRVTRRAAERLAAGHLWVYRSDLELGLDTDGLAPGALVTVEDFRGKPLGSGLCSTASQIAVRMVSRAPGLTRERYLIDLRERVNAALARRRVLASSSPETNGLRLLFSEADDLPGIVADRYNDLVIVQLLTQGTAQDDVRAVLADALSAALPGPLTVWERPDPRIRELERLPAPPERPLYTTETTAPTETTVTLNGLRFGYNAAAGQKTGAFLDQRLNYAAAARAVLASGRTGRALDVCTYHGGFALHLAQVCEQVTGIDQSRSALEVADRNAALNPELRAVAAGQLDWIEADAFELLRALDDAHRAHFSPGSAPGAPLAAASSPRLGLAANREKGAGLPLSAGPFDAIVLDPPAFAKSKRAAEGALRGYKELNLRALRLLAPGGTLVTCSCSHHVSLADFTAVVTAAAVDAGRRVQLLETRTAAPDHPEVLTLPETRYLKCLLCRVE